MTNVVGKTAEVTERQKGAAQGEGARRAFLQVLDVGSLRPGLGSKKAIGRAVGQENKKKENDRNRSDLRRSLRKRERRN